MGDEGDIIDVSDSCIVCGEKKAMIKAGFLYCLECGTRSQESQPMLDFTAEFPTTSINYKRVRSNKSKSKGMLHFSFQAISHIRLYDFYLILISIFSRGNMDNLACS